MTQVDDSSGKRSSSDAVEARLWASWRANGDSVARSALVDRYLGLVRLIARSVYRTNNPHYVDLRDLQQLGSVGLIEAISRFDPDRGVSFQQFAGIRIRGAILNGLPNLSELHAQQAFRRRTRKERVESLKSLEGSESKPDAFTAMVELTLGLAIGYMLEGTHLYTDDEGDKFSYADSADIVVAADSFRALLGDLTERQRQIVEYHYQGGLEFAEIASLMNLTRGRISQLHRSALETLRKAYKSRVAIDLRI